MRTLTPPTPHHPTPDLRAPLCEAPKADGSRGLGPKGAGQEDGGGAVVTVVFALGCFSVGWASMREKGLAGAGGAQGRDTTALKLLFWDLEKHLKRSPKSNADAQSVQFLLVAARDRCNTATVF
ncbi:unnamed protein product [Pleuronectes platessa]|uniref:Uncharacterized protein n=1 Tax=Pleuronectes platessa TaxID=8262 RepID=A0A9N7TR21_PLEPL|nr:unnamed protein product [Pleuronectes platessa]